MGLNVFLTKYSVIIFKKMLMMHYRYTYKFVNQLILNCVKLIFFPPLLKIL